MLYIQTSINNIVVVNIEYTSNELYYDFRLQNNLNILFDMSTKNWNAFRLKYQKNIEKAISWANIITKFNYDWRYISLNLKKISKIYLRLHYDYIIFDTFNKKLSQQRVDFFIISNKINALVYWLKVLLVMIIHSIIFIAQLKFYFIDNDLYKRSCFNDENFFSMITKNDYDSTSHYEIENLIKKRISREKLQYLIKWQNYKSIYNVWYNIDDLNVTQKLINIYEEMITTRLNFSTRTRCMRMFFDLNDTMIFKDFDRNTWHLLMKIFTNNHNDESIFF